MTSSYSSHGIYSAELATSCTSEPATAVFVMELRLPKLWLLQICEIILIAEGCVKTQVRHNRERGGAQLLVTPRPFWRVPGKLERVVSEVRGKGALPRLKAKGASKPSTTGHAMQNQTGI